MTSTIDEVGPWTEVKVEIVQEYAKAFTTITGSRSYFKRIYIDGFAGGGRLLSEQSGEIVAGTPLRIVKVEPSFSEYHFVERDPAKVAALQKLVGGLPHVQVHDGDSNEVLLRDVLPGMTYGSYRKGLLFLDPYGLHVDWRVIEAAGKSRCVDLLINFPIMDMNRNVLRRDLAKVAAGHVARMNRFWGEEECWRSACYDKGLFDGILRKRGNDALVEAFRERLQAVAGFEHVSGAFEMRNKKNAVVYCLIGASSKPHGLRVFEGVFKKWRGKGGVTRG